jgi:hypothetical protein
LVHFSMSLLTSFARKFIIHRRPCAGTTAKLIISVTFAATAFSPAFSRGSVLFNEVMYHPASTNVLEEWIELYNPAPTNVSLAGWKLAKAIDFTFPTNTSIAAGGYLVIASDPVALANATGITAVGPYIGQLDNSGEDVRLVDRPSEVWPLRVRSGDGRNFLTESTQLSASRA